MSTTEPAIPRVRVEYEYGGSFDKGEQGWCCSRVIVEQAGSFIIGRPEAGRFTGIGTGDGGCG